MQGSQFAPDGPFMGRIPVGRPTLPVEIFNMEDGEYREMMLKAGYSERFIQKEMDDLERYKKGVLPKPEELVVKEGPHLTDQQRALNRRRKQEIGEDV